MPSPTYPIRIGNNSARVVASELSFDPANGFTTNETWEGDEDALNALLSIFSTAGYRGTVSQYDGPVYRMRLSRPTDPGTGNEVPQDRWEFDTEFAQESIWSNPNIVQAIGTDDNVVGMHNAVQDGVTKKMTYSAFQNLYQPQFGNLILELYTVVQRGLQAVEFERKIIRRVRTTSIYYSGAVILRSSPFIYSSAALISVYGMPSFVSARMPETPSYAPSFSTWSWKKRRDTSTVIPSLNKVEEVKDWVFAPWYDRAHTLIA